MHLARIFTLLQGEDDHAETGLVDRLLSGDVASVRSRPTAGTHHGQPTGCLRRCCRFVDCHHRTATLDRPFTHAQRWLAPGTGVTDFIHCEQISIS